MDDRRELPRLSSWPAALAVLNALLHLAVVGRYGYFRDELYYVACGERLAWGATSTTRRSWRWSRGLPLRSSAPRSSACGSCPSSPARRWCWRPGCWPASSGDGASLRPLAGHCVIVAPVFLFNFHILSMNVFDVLFWTLGAWIVARLLRTENPRLWLAFGALAGIGLLNKWSYPGLFTLPASSA
jgi:Dolichyl-phosphate-mannose-protein mannosyltransferase